MKWYPGSPAAATGKSRKLEHKSTFRAQFGKMVKNEITFTYLEVLKAILSNIFVIFNIFLIFVMGVFLMQLQRPSM